MTDSSQNLQETKQDKQARSLSSQLWAMANDLRGKMDASEFRDYILGFIFYRYLSNRQEHFMQHSGWLSPKPGETTNQAYARQVEEDGIEDYRRDITETLGYSIDPEYTWESLLEKIRGQKIRPEDFQNLFDRFRENSSMNVKSAPDFKDVFDDINLMNSSLGNSTAARAKAL